MNDSPVDPRSDLIAAAQHFYHHGWMVGTAGNLSARSCDGSFWITASGRSKGKLTPADFVRIAMTGKVLEAGPNAKPSAETSIHQILYTLFPEAQACYHVHSVEANLASRLAQSDNLALPPLEMLKGLGIWEENPVCAIPIFANHSQVDRIATDIQKRFASNLPQISALLIRDHGVTVWGPSTEAALNYVELTEYLFRYIIAAHKLNL